MGLELLAWPGRPFHLRGLVGQLIDVGGDMSSSEFVLYNYFRSSASHRVRLALHLKKIDFEYRPVHLLNNGGEQYDAHYTGLNPSQQVPTLIHSTSGQSNVIGQSLAIFEYLDMIAPSPALFSKDPFERALCFQACEIVNSGTQPYINLKTLKELEQQFGADQEKKNAWSVFWIKNGLAALEKFLTPHARDFCFGSEVGAADCCLVPQLYSADRFQVNMTPYPVLTRIRQNCETLPAFQKASPFAQIDTPDDLRTTKSR